MRADRVANGGCRECNLGQRRARMCWPAGLSPHEERVASAQPRAKLGKLVQSKPDDDPIVRGRKNRTEVPGGATEQHGSWSAQSLHGVGVGFGKVIVDPLCRR